MEIVDITRFKCLHCLSGTLRVESKVMSAVSINKRRVYTVLIVLSLSLLEGWIMDSTNIPSTVYVTTVVGPEYLWNPDDPSF